MRVWLSLGTFLTAILAMTTSAPSARQVSRTTGLSAPTYYIVAEAVGCEPNPNYVEFRGASNLPPGTLVTANVADFDSDAWKDYSDATYVPVSEQGFFAGTIRPKTGMRFHRNFVLQVFFTPFRPKQPDSVLEVIGKKGEKLGQVAKVRLIAAGVSERPAVNPQLIQWSGEVYGLWTIARVPSCGEAR